MIIGDLEHTGAPESAEWTGGHMLATGLGQEERETHDLPDFFWELANVPE